MNKKLISYLVASIMAISVYSAAPAFASTSVIFGPLTINLDGIGGGSPTTLDGGDGTLGNPWQVGFKFPSNPNTQFGVAFSGDAVTACTAKAGSTFSGFSVTTFVSANNSCGFQMNSTATGIFGVSITYSGGEANIYFTRTGSTIGSGSDSSSTPAPAKYAGPEFSALSAKPVMQGTSTTLTGKRLTQVSSIEIGGKAASFTSVSETELSLTPAPDLAPGTYDLVILSAAGKLTHINAVRVQSPLKAFSITSVSEGRITNDQYIEHGLIASMQQPELNKARCIVNGPNLAQAKAQAERLCALVRASNKNIETTVVESRSTVKNNKVYARVTYGWN